MAVKQGSTRTYVLSLNADAIMALAEKIKAGDGKVEKLIDASNPSQVLRHAGQSLFEVHAAGREEFVRLYKAQVLAGQPDIEAVAAEPEPQAGEQVDPPQSGSDAPQAQDDAPAKSKKSKEAATA